jgi:hypothetical protein
MASKNSKKTLRSQAWWDNSENPEMTALYLEHTLRITRKSRLDRYAKLLQKRPCGS